MVASISIFSCHSPPFGADGVRSITGRKLGKHQKTARDLIFIESCGRIVIRKIYDLFDLFGEIFSFMLIFISSTETSISIFSCHSPPFGADRVRSITGRKLGRNANKKSPLYFLHSPSYGFSRIFLFFSHKPARGAPNYFYNISVRRKSFYSSATLHTFSLDEC